MVSSITVLIPLLFIILLRIKMVVLPMMDGDKKGWLDEASLSTGDIDMRC